MRRIPLPPPERFTPADALHIVLGLMMIPLGIVILVRTLPIAVTATALVAGLAFIGFGVYRTWFALQRYRLYLQNRGHGK